MSCQAKALPVFLFYFNRLHVWNFLTALRLFRLCVAADIAFIANRPHIVLQEMHGSKEIGSMARSSALLDKPVLPSKKDAELATESSRILSALEGNEEFRVRLEGGRELVLPSAAKTLLTLLLTEMSRGNAVTIIPIHAELTTQEAADFLNVSRPYLISLLEKNEIKFHMVGTHRRIRFEDLSAYKQNKDREREADMAELAKLSQELDMGY
jgi:excisionase family DNA binding protein